MDPSIPKDSRPPGSLFDVRIELGSKKRLYGSYQIVGSDASASLLGLIKSICPDIDDAFLPPQSFDPGINRASIACFLDENVILLDIESDYGRVSILTYQSGEKKQAIIRITPKASLTLSGLPLVADKLPGFASGGLVGLSSLEGLTPALAGVGPGGGSPVNITLPAGGVLNLATGVSTVEDIKRVMANEARKVGRRVRR